jgi:2-dehydropantoate 2-reductase
MWCGSAATDVRYVVLGAGAVGGTIGARLFEAGHEVVLIARGAHLEALRADGLRYGDPERTRVLRIPAVGDPSEVTWRVGDVVVLATKSQHTEAALTSASVPPSVAVVCAQNGVESERRVLRRFPHVYGMCVMLPATHVEAGAVDADSLPVVGVLDVGCYPDGVDDTIAKVAGDLSGSGFRSQPDPAVMRWKYEKLLVNLASALRALCGPEAEDDAEAAVVRAGLVVAVRQEALACYERAGIRLPSADEQRQRWEGALTVRPIAGRPRAAGSSWQSLARATGNIETDYLNGEIALLGRLHGVATPVNAAIQRLANDAARRRLPPGSVAVAEVAAAAGLAAPVVEMQG